MSENWEMASTLAGKDVMNAVKVVASGLSN